MISRARPTISVTLAQIKVAPYQTSNLNANPCKDLMFRNCAKSHKKRRNSVFTETMPQIIKVGIDINV